MSSIERAIDKISGESTDSGDSKAEQQGNGSDSDLRADRPKEHKPEERKEAPDHGEPKEGAADDAAPAVSAAKPEPAKAKTENEAPVHVIDMDRLAAAGHLIPDATLVTREGEEYQHIKRRLLGNMVEGVLNAPRPSNLIMITSSLPGEGKTFTSVNLALSMSMEVDHTVLAIDTDIVKKDLSRRFGLENRPGLYDRLGNPSLKLEELLVRTSVPNLVILPVGQSRQATTERLASAEMRALTDEIAARYRDRVILFDSPPLLATTTATALAPLVGQLIVVVEASRTKQETVRAAIQRLDGNRITGLILNKSRQPATRDSGYYGYYYRAEQ